MLQIKTLWIGGRLGYVEQLCLKSMVAQGHPVCLYHYEPLEGVPEGVTIRPGDEIVPLDQLPVYEKTGSWALGANLFRYLMLQRVDGIWLDVDVFLLKPIRIDSKVIFALQNAIQVNNAVLRLPPDSPVLRDLVALFCSRPILLPWERRRKRLAQRLLALIGRDARHADFGWGTFGPRALTHFLGKHGMFPHALPAESFYSVPWDRAREFFDPEVDILRGLPDGAVGLHLWNEMIRDLKRQPPPPGSFIATQCAVHGVNTGATA